MFVYHKKDVGSMLPTLFFKELRSNSVKIITACLYFQIDIIPPVPVSANKMRPKKVYTPGSKPPKPGRPKKRSTGLSRQGNYRTKYSQEALQRALKSVGDKRMSFGEASKHYGRQPCMIG